MGKQASKLILTFLFAISPVFAGTSTDVLATSSHFKPQVLQPGFDHASGAQQTITFDYTQNQEIKCPDGYVLVSVQAQAQQNDTVKVYQECNGVASGYVHVWCNNDEHQYPTIKSVPKQTFTCQRLKNTWVDTKKG